MRVGIFYPVHGAHADGPELPEVPRADHICSFLMITQWIRLSMRPGPRVNCALPAFINVVQSPWHGDLLSLLADLLLVFKQDVMLELHDPQIKLSLTYFQV